MSLEEKVVLITNGADEIGKATAKAAIAAGAKVVFSCLQEESEFVRTLIEAGGEAIFQPTNITRSDRVEVLMERIVTEFGRLDIVFNNIASQAPRGLLNQLPEQEVFDAIDDNVFGTWVAMKYQIDQMLRNGGGIIVNNCGILGTSAFPTHSVNAATHHAIAGMTKASALEYARFKIRINGVAPGFIDMAQPENNGHTNLNEENSPTFVPMARLGQPQEVVKAIFWLCSSESSFTTGHIIPVDGGFNSR